MDLLKRYGDFMPYVLINWPNVLTFARISFIPLIVLSYYLPGWGHALAAVLFAVAAITDWLDGYLARHLQQTTNLGAFLDPVADKLLVCIALLLIVGEQRYYLSTDVRHGHFAAFVLTIPAIVIVCRELIVSALRERMAELGSGMQLAVCYLGKLKTVMQMLALMTLLFCDEHTNFYIILCGYIFLYTAVILTIWSMLLYLKIFFKINKKI